MEEVAYIQPVELFLIFVNIYFFLTNLYYMIYNFK